jgi:two-component system, NtrC family, nitrogen regulation response regulator GlnG
MFRRSAHAKSYLVAESPAMRRVVDQVTAYAATDVPVLICGEHGTGRELVARVLHQAGPRRHARFVAVRPTFEGADVPVAAGAARPSGNAADDAADDAVDRTRRALRAAAGGTLLVKDVCDVPAPSQRALKRAIRHRGPRPAERGGDQGDTSGEVFDVRVVGTAELDLERAVDARILSRELYEQLAAHRIDVPPLRDRVDDIPSLTARWVGHYAGEIGRARVTLSTRAQDRLQRYPWPGNVAELKSICRRLVISVERSRIEAGDVDEVLPVVAERVPLEDMAFEDMVKAKLAGLMARIDGYPVHDLYEKVLARVERPLFDLVLERTGGNQVKAAELLGMNRNTLRKKLDALGMTRKRRAGREDEALDGD